MDYQFKQVNEFKLLGMFTNNKVKLNRSDQINNVVNQVSKSMFSARNDVPQKYQLKYTRPLYDHTFFISKLQIMYCTPYWVHPKYK